MDAVALDQLGAGLVGERGLTRVGACRAAWYPLRTISPVSSTARRSTLTGRGATTSPI
jgi:hypothetical protein